VARSKRRDRARVENIEIIKIISQLGKCSISINGDEHNGDKIEWELICAFVLQSIDRLALSSRRLAFD